MSSKGTHNKRTILFDRPELVQKLRQSRTNYDYPVQNLSFFSGDWVILETFVPDIKTKHSRKDKPIFLLIIRTLSDPKNPESDPTWSRFKVFSGSRRVNNFLLGLRESDEELTALPLVIRFLNLEFTDRKTGQKKHRIEIDCGLDEKPLGLVP